MPTTIAPMNAAIQAAREVSALVPTKPKGTLLGGEAHRAECQIYGAFYAAAVGAWRYAAHQALNDAASSCGDEWVIDHDNHQFIDGVKTINDLEAMCDADYPWTGRRPDQA